MSGCTALALSQSGRTPDVVEYVAAREAPRCVHGRGHERRRRPSSRARPTPFSSFEPEPSTRSLRRRRTRTRSLRSACSPRTPPDQGDAFADELRTIAATMQRVHRDPSRRAIANVAIPFAYAGRMFVVGRGAEFATAREIALKLLETCRIAAEPLTATDLAHGPVAALDSLFPVWAIASDDATLPAVVEAVERAREAGATIVASGERRGGDPRRGVRAPEPADRRRRCSRRCCRSSRASSSPGRWPARAGSIPTRRAACRR